jgi:hypothetical protein
MAEEDWEVEPIPDVKLILNNLPRLSETSDFQENMAEACVCFTINFFVLKELLNLVGGRTPLHIACARSDPLAAKIVKLLVGHSANPNLICNGQSPLSLAIAAGNRDAIDVLLKSDLCDPSLPLTLGVGSSLCCVASTLYEHYWAPADRLKLVNIFKTIKKNKYFFIK